MKTSLNWIKSMVDLDMPLDDLLKLINFQVIEIDGVERLINATELVVGEVLECISHPDSDHLHICKVDLGTEITQIVCGAPNVAKGQKVIVAKIGAELPNNFRIKKSKIRGVESNGMICSLQELGLEEKYVEEEFKNGIYVLGSDAKNGEDPIKYLGLDDTVIELGLTPNRADLLSHLGFAYDLAAVTKQTVKYEMPKVIEIDEKNPVSVKVDTDLCPYYSARYIKNVKIQQSPRWLKNRLIASGIRPINNVVDITNYVLMELGQPLHAFDAKVMGNNIVVRNAKKLEKMTTLDDIERTLDVSDCVITNGEKIMAIGGVMGGLNSSVTDETTDIILESAYFDPLAIRKTSSKLQLRSDSSMRFERKVDPARVNMALERATELFETICGGKALKGIAYAKSIDTTDKKIDITLEKINSMLGTLLDIDTVTDIFKRLGFGVTNNGSTFTVMVPTRRVDIEMYQDLVEEVGRIYGYNNIPATIPASTNPGGLSYFQSKIRKVKDLLEGMGNNEVITYTLVNDKKVDLFNDLFGDVVRLSLPMSEDRSSLRQSQLNGIYDVIHYNMSRQVQDFSLYEIGRVYAQDSEKTLLSGAMAGYHSSSEWQGKKDKVDFYFVKGMLEVLFARLLVDVEFVKAEKVPNGFHPGITASIIFNGKCIGVLGAIHPSIAKQCDLPELYAYEIDLGVVLAVKKSQERFKSLPKYPTVVRDIAVVVDSSISAKQIMDLVKQTGKKTLISSSIFDCYEGASLGVGKKSIAISLVFQDQENTLEAQDVDKRVKSIVERLERELNAKLR